MSETKKKLKNIESLPSKDIIYTKCDQSFLVQQNPQKSCTVNIPDNKICATKGSGHVLFSSLKHLSIIRYHHGTTQRSIELKLNSTTIVPEYKSEHYHNSDADYGRESTEILIHGLLSGPHDHAHILQQINCVNIMVKKICNVSKFNIPAIIKHAITRYTVYLSTDIIYIFNSVEHMISRRSCIMSTDHVPQLNVLQINEEQHNFDILETIPFQIKNKKLSTYKFYDGFHFMYKNNPFLVRGWSNITSESFDVFEFETINNSFLSHTKYFSYSKMDAAEEVKQKHFDELPRSKIGTGHYCHYYFDLNVANDINQRFMYIMHYYVYWDLFLLDKETQLFIVKDVTVPFNSFDENVDNARLIQSDQYIYLCVKENDVIAFKIK